MAGADNDEFFRAEAARYRELAAEHRTRLEQTASGSSEYVEAESRALLYDYLAHAAERWLSHGKPNPRRPRAGEPPETLGC